MKLIGRKLEMGWGNGITMVLEKRVDKKLKEYESKLYDVFDFDGETIYKEVQPINKPYGQDLNTICGDSSFWMTEEEYEQIPN